LDEHRLADAGPAEEANLPALHVRSYQIDDLDAGLEDLDLRGQVAEGRRVTVDRPALGVGRWLWPVVDGVAEHVPEPAERDIADRDGDRGAGVHDVDAAREAVGRGHGDGANAVVAQQLLHVYHALGRLVAVGARHADAQRVVDLGQAVGEHRVDDDALDLDDLSDVLTVLLARHSTPRGAEDWKGLAVVA